MIDAGLGAELLQQVTDRPPSADTFEAHRLAVLEAQADQARAIAGFFDTLKILALEGRAFLALEREKRFGKGRRR